MIVSYVDQIGHKVMRLRITVALNNCFLLISQLETKVALLPEIRLLLSV